ncbi:MAG TPA: glycoside hydrolase family 47 protein [Ignavibacteriaceae bacterium]|nr:glycoside hydrolase family 47 protein [Ignavibacteriaceae bacterium]
MSNFFNYMEKLFGLPLACIFIIMLGTVYPQNEISNYSIDKQMLADSVRNEFLHAWNSYKQFAMGHDEVKPLSKTFRDWHSVPLLMTPVDALDVMYLMGLDEEAESTKNFIIENLSFDEDIFVKNFEITIRLLGGLLSNYQISGDSRLLALAEDLGKRLLPAFNSPTGMPYMFVNLQTGEVKGDVSNPAEIGTLLIEFGTLSKLTGNPIYFEKAKRALVELYNHRSPIGLVGSSISVTTGIWVDGTSHISGGIDSYYEYLLKCAILFNDKDCLKMWQTSIEAINKYLSHETQTGLWYGQVNMFRGEITSTRYGSLDAFFPAVLALSGDIEKAARLQKSSDLMWRTFGIEPEEIDYYRMKITFPTYHLRPEIIESAYYLYHFTNDSLYLNMGKHYFENLVQYCRNENGYSALINVVTKEKADEMESFFFAETLKYLYLLFAEQDVIDFSKVIFNTEAHPIWKTWK